MSQRIRVLQWLASTISFLTPAIAAQISPNPVVPVARPQPVTKPLKINEVQFDPFGQDGGNEWVELFNSGMTAVNVAGVQIKDNAGVVLATLPNVTLPGAVHYVVHFGPTVADISDGNLADGRGNFFTGQAPGNYLGNNFGGIYLTAGGQVYDAVFWGTGGPPRGPGYSAAVTANQWSSNAYVELSHTSGHARSEGSTLGRDVMWTDTNKPADFMLDGGENAAYPTAGIRNDMFVFTKERAIHWTQAVAQEFLSIVSTSNHMEVSVTSAAHANVVVTDPDLTGGFTIQADHSFDLLHDGAPVSLNGPITFDYVRNGSPGATSYSATASATLNSSDGNLSLSFSYTKAESGFHSLTRTLTGTSSFTWTEEGEAYVYNASNTHTTTQTGQNTWVISDNRNWTDWGRLAKTSSSSQTLTKTGDGRYHHSATHTQTSPPPPPHFGHSQFVIGTETLTYEADMVFDNDFGVTKTITRLDNELTDTTGYLLSLAELSQPASYTVTRSGGQFLSPLGSFDITLSKSVRFGYPDPDPDDTGWDYQVTDTLTRELVAGEFVEHGASTSPLGSLSYYIDAPAQQACGCGCGATGCNCGGADETTVGDVVGIASGVGVITGACTYGTIMTTPATITGVGALLPAGIATVCAAGAAVWWLTWEMW